MTIYTAEHLVAIQGENLHLLAWAMKQQRIDNLAVTSQMESEEGAEEWSVTSITAAVREEG